jgi:hypothetical protein
LSQQKRYVQSNKTNSWFLFAKNHTVTYPFFRKRISIYNDMQDYIKKGYDHNMSRDNMWPQGPQRNRDSGHINCIWPQNSPQSLLGNQHWKDGNQHWKDTSFERSLQRATFIILQVSFIRMNQVKYKKLIISKIVRQQQQLAWFKI